MKNKLLLFFTLSLFSSCSPRIITTILKKEKPLSNSVTVIVYDKKDILPYNEKIGVTKVNDNVSSAEFNYNSVVEIAKLEASKAGGNAIRVIKHQLPNLPFRPSLQSVSSASLSEMEIRKVYNFVF